MRAYVEDIICAQATPAGRGAVSIVRVSGKGSQDLVKKLTSSSVVIPRQASYHKIYYKGLFIDEVLSLYFEEGRSFTGEESFEIQCHGSPLVVSRIVAALCELGARIAEPGEFSYRAYLNGKMDLTKAEGIHYTIQARNDLAQNLSLNLLEGSLKKEILQIRDELLWAVSRVEASIDFSDQDIDLNHDKEVFNKIKSARSSLNALSKSFHVGSIQAKGIRVVLVGAPNAGKSTLFNDLLNEERSIVSDQKGTTRDYIQQTFSLAGHDIEIFDTAGLRKSDDLIEAQGIERTLDFIKNKSQLILFLVSLDTIEESLPYFDLVKESKTPYFIVETKQDLEKWSSSFDGEKIPYSMGSKHDLGLLKALMSKALEPFFDLQSSLFLERHRELVANAIEDLKKIASFSCLEAYEDVISSLLYSSLEFLNEILYIDDPEFVRDKIFKDFCLGK